MKIVDGALYTSAPGFSMEDLKRGASICVNHEQAYIVELHNTYARGRKAVYGFLEYGGGGSYEVLKWATAGLSTPKQWQATMSVKYWTLIAAYTT